MTRPQSRSFRNRLLCSFLIASLVPMIICSALLSQIFRIQMKKQMESDAQTQTTHLMTALDHVSDALPAAAGALEESGLLPRALTDLSPFHGSLYITSMASLGIPPIYHHLYDFGNVPVFCSFGKKRRASCADTFGKRANIPGWR